MEIVHTVNREKAHPNYKFTYLVDEYGKSVYKLCRSLAYCKEDADDLFQETFVKVLEQPRKIMELDNPQGFLFSTTIYIWKDWKRKYARRKRLAEFQPLDENIPNNSSMEESYVQQEEIQLVRELVKELPDKFRVPIILYYTLEMSVPDMAEALNLPIGTVKSRLFKARKMIEKGLVEHDYEI